MSNLVPDEAERLSDISDRASAIEQQQNASAIRENARKLEQRQKPRADGTYEFTDCEDCGLEIDAKRLQLAAANHLCWHCATAQEKRQQRGLGRFVNIGGNES